VLRVKEDVPQRSLLRTTLATWKSPHLRTAKQSVGMEADVCFEIRLPIIANAEGRGD
jgi:hypothetical protein